MTLTVKLDASLEAVLRSRCAVLGRSVSAVMRDALQAYLSQTESPKPSPYELGQDLFGQHAGPAHLAGQRKADLLQIWDQKHPVNPSAAPHGAP